MRRHVIHLLSTHDDDITCDSKRLLNRKRSTASMGNGDFRLTTESTPLTDRRNFVTGDYTSATTIPLHQIWCKSVYLLYTSILGTHLGMTSRRIFALDASNDADSRKDALLGFLLILHPTQWDKSPKPQFWGVNRHF